MGEAEYYWDGRNGQVYSLTYCEMWPHGTTIYELHNVYDSNDVRKVKADDVGEWFSLNAVNEMQVIALAPR